MVYDDRVQSVSSAARMVDVQGVRDALDLDRRLALVPGTAEVRGFLFKMTADEVAHHGRAAMIAYRSMSPVKSTWFFRMYSVRDYLEDVAAAAAAIAPGNPHQGLRSIWGNSPRYAPLFNAQRFLSLLGASPVDVMRWLEAQRDMFANYGGWRLEKREERYFVMHYFDEYIWIDSAHRGGLEGILRACSVSGSVTTELDTDFNGRCHVRWQPP
jgi:uncharacterized protein (TIGR02265 family)